MSLPFISCICCTYGRVERLQEAIACFLNQQYDGRKELIVYNTLKEQVLEFDHPEVRVINAALRPTTIGETRNAAIALADGQLIVTWDDDDLYLPAHLQQFGRVYDSGDGWFRMDRQFYAEGGRLKSITHGTMNTVAFTRRAWTAIGRYHAINTGEDHDFYSRVSARFTGKTIHLADDEVTFIYGWGQLGLYHLSGEGEDKPGAKTGLERVEQWVGDELKAGRIPAGHIVLQPALQQDYVRLAQSFTGAVKRIKSERVGKVGLICLGRFGDVLNILPVAKFIADVWAKPRFYIAREFASVLDGISYVEPVPLDVPYNQVRYALTVAQTECQHVLNASVHGEHFTVEKLMPSFNMEAWRLVGFLRGFIDGERFPLVIDRRDVQRESALSASALKNLAADQPLALVSVNCSLSSPMPDAARAHADICHLCAESGYQVLDLCQIRAERIYDLLELMACAELLITTDTAPLHLAAASDIPVIALTNDKEWLGSIPRYQTLASGTYLNYAGTVEAGLSDALPAQRRARFPAIANRKTSPRIFHAVEAHACAHRDTERRRLARASWEALPDWTVVETAEPYENDARSIGDTRPLPRLTDIIWNALSLAGDDDIVVWTNSDVTLHPLLPGLLKLFCALHGACTAMRMDFMPHRRPNLSHDPDEIAAQCTPHLGRDLMAATKSWWVQNWPQIPAAYLGAPLFDLHLAALVRHDKGWPFTRQNLDQRVPCCELPPGYVLHEFHRATWGDLPSSTPSHSHNSRLFREWAEKCFPDLKFTAEGNI